MYNNTTCFKPNHTYQPKHSIKYSEMRGGFLVGEVNGYGGGYSIGAILVLFILLVIIASSFGFGIV